MAAVDSKREMREMWAALFQAANQGIANMHTAFLNTPLCKSHAEKAAERAKFLEKELGMEAATARGLARQEARIAQAKQLGKERIPHPAALRDKNFDLSACDVDNFGELLSSKWDARRSYVSLTLLIMPPQYFDEPLRPEFEDIYKRLYAAGARFPYEIDREKVALDEAYVRQWLADNPEKRPPPKPAIQVYRFGEKREGMR